MSEALPGVPAPPPPPPPRDASAVILFRRAPGLEHQVELFWLEREQTLRFAGGFFAFPGGRVDKADALVPVVGLEGPDARFVVTAARELFEETGVLKARGAEKLAPLELDELRKALLAETLEFGALLAQRGFTLHAEDFVPAGRWVTPRFVPGGFDARFFLVESVPSHAAQVWKGELASGEWIAPRDALARWENGTALLHPPNLHAVQTMAGFTDVPSAIAKLTSPGFCTDFISERIEFQRGITLFALVTPTLPPATHTNCYLLGTGELLIVDPGSPDDAEIDRLVAFLRAVAPEGLRAKAIVLTHHHGDHLGGVERLVELTQLPVWAHERTADRCPVPVARTLHDGDVLTLDGPLVMNWKVLHTPGHARGHVTLVDERTRAAVVGDMVAGFGTIVIDPPEGEMAEYLKQLSRLETLPVRTLYPSHGPVIPDGPAKLQEYQAHRAWREAKVFEVIASFGKPTSIEDVVPRAYDDVAAFVWPIAQRNTEAIIEKLAAEKRITRDGDTVALP
jgi:glyoxylase-like metal-dependent hydrolase (beta-lactamase superfamily II)/8-oxo-dGTP pyrophosphatase MutT (NUDIX family)